jgi:hypothetical protein
MDRLAGCVAGTLIALAAFFLFVVAMFALHAY